PLWPATNTRRPVSGNRILLPVAVMALALFLHRFAVGVHHFAHQLAEAGLVLPPQPGARLGRVAEQEIDLGRTEIARVDLDQDVAGFGVDALLLHTLAAPRELAADM